MWHPKVVHEGASGTLYVAGRAVGTIGHWRVCMYGDDRPYLTAQGCRIPQLWVHAGLKRVRVVGRPLRGARAAADLTIEGDVARIGTDVLSLGNITIQGAEYGESNV
jgi:hypothetical protein